MYNLITYEMACTVIGLKFLVENFLSWTCHRLLKEYIFALLLQFLTFLVARCFLFKCVNELKGTGKNDLNVNLIKAKVYLGVVAKYACVCPLPWR